MIEVQLNGNEVAKGLFKELAFDERAIRTAKRQALSRTGAKGRTTMIKEIVTYIKRVAKGKSRVRAKDVRKQVIYRRPTFQNLTATITFAGFLIPAGRLNATQTADGVIVTTPKGTMLLRGAFIAPYARGRGKGVFRRDRRRGPRRGAPRAVKRGSNKGKRYRPQLPIRKQSVTVATPTEFERYLFDRVDERVTGEWDKELEVALRRQWQLRNRTVN